MWTGKQWQVFHLDKKKWAFYWKEKSFFVVDTFPLTVIGRAYYNSGEKPLRVLLGMFKLSSFECCWFCAWLAHTYSSILVGMGSSSGHANLWCHPKNATVLAVVSSFPCMTLTYPIIAFINAGGKQVCHNYSRGMICRYLFLACYNEFYRIRIKSLETVV